MGILANMGIKRYQNTWEEVDRQSFSEEDCEIIDSVEVVPSNFGISAKLLYIDGEVSFIPLSRDNQEMAIGTPIDLKKCFLVTLKRGNDTATKLLVTE